MRIACIGECMIEIAAADPAAGRARLGIAGDSFNTAVYLARRARPGWRVDYLTRLGRDAFSDAILARMRAEGIGTGAIGRDPVRLPGLYAITTDAAGERSFRYWRGESAARRLFDAPGPQLDDLAGYDLIYVTGITLAILAAPVRAALLDRLAALARAGTRLAFDPNHRPLLWADPAEARAAYARAASVAAFALPSLDDLQRLEPGVGAETAARALAAAGAGEVCVKAGAAGATLCAGGAVVTVAAPPARRVRDTTGAGDSFNAAYLAARLSGATPEDAAAEGHRLARAVIAHPGAILPARAMPRPRRP